jgi:hypothetical protein
VAEFTEQLHSDLTRFQERIMTDLVGVLDPEGVLHHEFVSGNHGRKLDFDKIETGTDLYIDWVSMYARVVKARYAQRMPDALVGIANGANRLSVSVGFLLGIPGLETQKVDAKTVTLNGDARDHLADNEVRFALTIEDVGTTGSTTASAIGDLRQAGVRRIESVNGWQRNPTLPRLDELRIPYSAVILQPLPMFSPEQCASQPEGYCAQGVPLVEHA